MITPDSPAAPILCKVGFTCPIVANMETNGNDYNSNYGTTEGTWNVAGPWGSGGSTITVYGNSRCSSTSGTALSRGSPVAGGGEYCWCQITNNGVLSAWAFRSRFSSRPEVCTLNCAGSCVLDVRNGPNFRAVLCSSSVGQNNSCNGTTVIAEGVCPAGYVQCIGTGTGGDTAGNYTITCSE
jgi:hypothetical protein